jgi:hypothetical protein
VKDPNDDSFRRAGDVLQLQLLEEMRYLRKRLDTVIDGMATKDSLHALAVHVDSETRALESKIDAQRVGLEAKIDAERTESWATLQGLNASVDALKRDKLPPWFVPAVMLVISAISALGGFFVHHP